jgi:ferredoxin
MPKYRVEIDLKTCISTAACYSTVSQHFKAGKNQQANVIGGETDESKSTHVFEDDKIANAQEGAKSCPVSAITVTQL